MLSFETSIRPGFFRVPDDDVASAVLIPGFRAAKLVQGVHSGGFPQVG